VAQVSGAPLSPSAACPPASVGSVGIVIVQELQLVSSMVACTHYTHTHCTLGEQYGRLSRPASAHQQVREVLILMLCSYSCCAHNVLILLLCSYCARAVLLLYSCCAHALLILYSCCAHTVLTLYSCSTHTLLILYSFSTHTLHQQ
jgi:hypothetical protein